MRITRRDTMNSKHDKNIINASRSNRFRLEVRGNFLLYNEDNICKETCMNKLMEHNRVANSFIHVQILTHVHITIISLHPHI